MQVPGTPQTWNCISSAAIYDASSNVATSSPTENHSQAVPGRSWHCRVVHSSSCRGHLSSFSTTLPAVCVLDAQPCRTLCDPTDCSLPGSSVYGIPQARILEWVSISSSSGSSRSRDQFLPALQADSLLSEPCQNFLYPHGSPLI